MRNICIQGGGRGNDFILERLEVIEILAHCLIAISEFKAIRGIFMENLQRAEAPSRLTDTSSADMTDIFLILFNAPFHCLTQHIQRFTGVLFRQLSCFDSCTAHGIVCAKDPTSPFSRGKIPAQKLLTAMQSLQPEANSIQTRTPCTLRKALDSSPTSCQAWNHILSVYEGGVQCKMQLRPLDSQKSTDKICAR